MIGKLVPTTELEPQRREQMLALMQEHFSGVTSGQFERDLQDKNWVILITDAAGALRGFSTLLFYLTSAPQRRLHVVYSGDTIVDAGARSDPALARTWIESVNRLRQEAGAENVYWLLLTSGFRTYRFLSVFWRAFWPRFDQPTPPEALEVLEALARERFGARFEPVTGIVRFEHPQPLREALLAVPPGRLWDPHVAFFASRNPGFRAGDELVCLCELTEDNLTSAGRRMVRNRRS